MIRGRRVLAQVLQTAIPSTTEMDGAVRDTAAVMGLRKKPRVLISSRVSSPFSVGLFHPTIVFPATSLEPHTLVAILRHECGHFLHRHHLVGHVQNIVDLIWWWHPVVRQFNHELRKDQEEICDRHAIAGSISPHDYAQCLARLATRASSTNAPQQAACLILKSDSLEGRIRRIINMKNTDIHKPSIHHRLLGYAIAASTGTIAMACNLAPAQAAPPLPPQEKPASAEEPLDAPKPIPTATSRSAVTKKPERRLETYDFYKLMVHRAPKVKHDLKRALEAATAVYAGKRIPRQALTRSIHLQFAAFLKTILRLGKDVEIVPGQNGHLVVLASRENHALLSGFRAFSILSLIDKPTLIPLRIEVLELPPKAFDRDAIPLLKEHGIPVGDDAVFSTISRSSQQDLFASLSKKAGVKALDSANLAANNLIPCTYSQLEQTSYVKDFKVTIANAKAIADPVVDVVEHGRLFALTPARLDRKRLAVILEVDHVHLKSPIPTFTAPLGVSAKPMTIQLPELTTTRRRSVFHLSDSTRAGLFINSTKNNKRLIVAVLRKK